MISVIPSRPGDVQKVLKDAETFDPRVLQECKSPEATLEEAVNKSERTWAVVADEDVIALVGVYPREDGSAFFWLMRNKRLHLYPYSFTKQTRAFFMDLLKDYTYITAVVNIHHAKSIRWLRWLGFEFADPFLHEDGETYYFNVWIKGGKWQTLSQ
jgi:hypothetical protein